jgi:putative iron-regulated protein
MVAGSPSDGLSDIVRGFTSMAISELYYERMTDPYLTQSPKDEESCFSESTQIDLAANMLGVQNVYLGRYGALAGPSISELIRAKNPGLDAQIQEEMTATRTAIDAIPPPFDQAVIAPATSDANQKVKAALDTFVPMITSLQQMADILGIKVNI